MFQLYLGSCLCSLPAWSTPCICTTQCLLALCCGEAHVFSCVAETHRGTVPSKVLHPFHFHLVHCVLSPPPSHDILSYSVLRVLCMLVPSVPDSLPSLGRPLRLALIASACSMATAHSCPANSFRMYAMYAIPSGNRDPIKFSAACIRCVPCSPGARGRPQKVRCGPATFAPAAPAFTRPSLQSYFVIGAGIKTRGGWGGRANEGEPSEGVSGTFDGPALFNTAAYQEPLHCMGGRQSNPSCAEAPHVAWVRKRGGGGDTTCSGVLPQSPHSAPFGQHRLDPGNRLHKGSGCSMGLAIKSGGACPPTSVDSTLPICGPMFRSSGALPHSALGRTPRALQHKPKSREFGIPHHEPEASDQRTETGLRRGPEP